MYSNDEATILSRKLREVMTNLFNEYMRLQQSSSSVNETFQSSELVSGDTSSMPQPPKKGKQKGVNKDFIKYLEEIGCANQTTELDKYIAEQLENGGEDDEFDILNWWKTNAYRLPILASIARDILAIPISIVASESAFSTDGRSSNDGGFGVVQRRKVVVFSRLVQRDQGAVADGLPDDAPVSPPRSNGKAMAGLQRFPAKLSRWATVAVMAAPGEDQRLLRSLSLPLVFSVPWEYSGDDGSKEMAGECSGGSGRTPPFRSLCEAE
nr:zinc finger BED domain-containing protein RICESLEEPER 2-like [Ipomoea batatas]